METIEERMQQECKEKHIMEIAKMRYATPALEDLELNLCVVEAGKSGIQNLGGEVDEDEWEEN